MADEFHFVYTVQVRISDFDAQRHLNNTAYITYVESARVAYTREVLGAGDEGGWVVAEIRCRYLAPIPVGVWQVDVRLRVSRVGNSSLTFSFALLLPDGTRAAEGEAVQVRIDLATGRSKPLDPHWRERIAAFEHLG